MWSAIKTALEPFHTEEEKEEFQDDIGKLNNQESISKVNYDSLVLKRARNGKVCTLSPKSYKRNSATYCAFRGRSGMATPRPALGIFGMGA